MWLSSKEQNLQDPVQTLVSIIKHRQQHILRQVKRANGLILQGMKTRMFHDLEAKGRNWHKELPSVLWALRTNVNRATRDTPFHLVYGADAVLPLENFLKSARVAHFNEEDQAEARKLDSNLLEEKHNTTLTNVQKYQESLKCYYNKSVVPRALDIGDLVLKKDIHTKDKHKFSSLWEGPFIVVDIATPGAYMLAKVDGSMLPNTWNADQLCTYYAWCIWLINKDTMFFILHLSAYPIIFQAISKSGMPDLVAQTEGVIQPNNKNDKSQKRDDAFLIWSDASPQLSIGQPPDQRQKGKRCLMHTTCID
jgi:hypothetical protein